MADPWVLVEALPAEAGTVVSLPAGEAHHLRKVLRICPGDEVVLCDGAGRIANAVLVPGEAGTAAVELRQVRQLPRPDPAAVPSVALGVLHGHAMDWAVQKAAELGVPRFVPVLCQRSQLGRTAASRRLEHWRRVALQALKQCRRAWRMELAAPCSLEELLREVAAGEGILADREGMRPGQLSMEGSHLLLVGPEGGLSETERAAVLRAGWPSVRLGEHVLRAETAVVAGVALLGR